MQVQSIGKAYGFENNYINYKDDKDSQLLIVSRSWIQAIGSVFSVIGQIKEGTTENQ